MSNLSHTHSVDRNSKAIRFYLWLYEADPEEINTCKLFWGFILSPLTLPIFSIAILLFRAINFFWDRTMARLIALLRGKAIARLSVSEEQDPTDLPAREPSFLSRLVDRVGNFMSKMWFKRIFKILFFIVIGFYILWMLTLLVIAAIHDPITVAIVLGSVFGAALATVGIVTLITYRDWRGSKTIHAVKGFGRLIASLGHSVHNQTCARVVLEDKPTTSG